MPSLPGVTQQGRDGNPIPGSLARDHVWLMCHLPKGSTLASLFSPKMEPVILIQQVVRGLNERMHPVPGRGCRGDSCEGHEVST